MAGQEDDKREPRTSGSNMLMERKRRQRVRQLQDAIRENSVEDHQTFEELLDHMDMGDINGEYRHLTPLMYAVKNGDIQYVQALLSKGADVFCTADDGNTVLHVACCLQNEGMIQTFTSFKHLLDVRNNLGCTALFLSAHQGFLPGVQMLVEGGADCNLASEKRETPLFIATVKGHVDVVKYLVNIPYYEVNQPDVHMQTPLIVAAESGNVEMVSALLSRSFDEGEKININFGTNVGPAIFSAIYAKHYDIVKELIRHGADLNLKMKGKCPLSCAISDGAVEISHLLIESGCDLDVTDTDGYSPLYTALLKVSDRCKGDSMRMLIQALLDAGADINMASKEGRTPLHLAASSSNPEIFDLLLKQGADPLAVTKNGDTVLHDAALGTRADFIECLLQKGCLPNNTNNLSCHALHIAVTARAPIEVLNALVEAGSDLNLQERWNGNTPLHQAVFWRNSEAALFLIKSGCDLAAENSSFQTAMYLACLRGNRKVVEAVLERLGNTLLDFNPCAIPMHVAAAEGHHDLVRQLIDVGYDINEMAVTGMTPIQTALSEDNLGVCAVLLERGASLVEHRKRPRILTSCCRDRQDPHPHFHMEPLFLAMQHKQPAMMELLLQCMPGLPSHILKGLRDILLKNSNVRSQFPAEMREDILTLIDKALKQPRPLLELCRGPVREVVGCPLRARLTQILGSNAILVPNFVCMTETFSSLEEKYEMTKVSRSSMRYAVL